MLERMSAIELLNWEIKHRRMLRIIIIIYEGKSAKIDEHLMSRLQILIEASKPLKFTSESSKFHSDVTKHLSLLLSEVQTFPEMNTEFIFEDYFRLDIAFPSCQLAIEVDGQCHFDEMGNYMPKNIIKETMLVIRKWDLMRITHTEWPGGNDYKSTFHDKPKRVLLLEKLSKFPKMASLF
jgi:hypothetical protein